MASHRTGGSGQNPELIQSLSFNHLSNQTKRHKMNAIFDQTDWSVLRISGPDRAKSLNNMSTQDIKKMLPETSSETFITNLQGKTIGFCTVHTFNDEILIRSNPDSLQHVSQALAKYSIFDNSSIEDITSEIDQLVLFGESVQQSLFSFTKTRTDQTQKIHYDQTVPGYQFPDQLTNHNGVVLLVPKGSKDSIIKSLLHSDNTNAFKGSDQEFERLRIRNAWPIYGQDILIDNLPQEIDRDATSISFNKGCYLGQETVARLDALGHVNRLLMGFVWKPAESTDASVKFSGTKNIQNVEGQTVGQIRSIAETSNPSEFIGLALIRIKALETPIHVESDPSGTIQFLKAADFRNQMK